MVEPYKESDQVVCACVQHKTAWPKRVQDTHFLDVFEQIKPCLKENLTTEIRIIQAEDEEIRISDMYLSSKLKTLT